MFDPTSRYFALPTAKLTVRDPDGTDRGVAYKPRRFLPPADATVLVEHTVVEGERLDHVTARYYGNPTLFWRVCDANGVLRPDELERVGRVVRIVMPQG